MSKTLKKVKLRASMSDNMGNFENGIDVHLRGHHVDQFILCDYLLDLGFTMTEVGCYYQGELVRGNQKLETLFHDVIRDMNKSSQDTARDNRSRIESIAERNPDKSYPWGDELVNYMSDAFCYMEPKGKETLKTKVLNLMHVIHNKHTTETPLEGFLNKASLEARTEVTTHLYLAHPDELVSINVYPDDICATCPVGLHCATKDIGQIFNGPNIDVPYIERFISYANANGIHLNAVFFMRYKNNDIPTEVIATMGNIRKFVLSDDVSM